MTITLEDDTVLAVRGKHQPVPLCNIHREALVS